MTTATIENVWDYPRPPRLDPVNAHIIVEFNGVLIAETRRAIRVLETSHPPNYYIPPEDVRVEFLEREPYSTVCEWKGIAHYYTLRIDEETSGSAAWCYADPNPDYRDIRHYITFYPARVSRITVDGEAVTPEPGDFYGGWITSSITGVGDSSRAT